MFLHHQMEPCYFGNLSVCHCRELLVIGGVAAKDQLAALEQGVCDTYSYAYSHPQKNKKRWLTGSFNYCKSNCWNMFFNWMPFFLFFSWCHLIIRLTLWWEHLVDWMTSFPLGNWVCPKSAFWCWMSVYVNSFCFFIDYTYVLFWGFLWLIYII